LLFTHNDIKSRSTFCKHNCILGLRSAACKPKLTAHSEYTEWVTT